MGEPGTFAALRRLLDARRQTAHLRCELCGVSLAGQHWHAVNTETRRLLCTCAQCADSTQAQSIRAVSTRYVHDGAMRISVEQWAALEIPVDLAFFFFNGALGRFIVSYPGPSGVVESALPLEQWQALIDAHPWLRHLDADVEAVIARRTTHGYECFVIPVDRCYELVGRIRTTWSGVSGGDTVRREVEMFFTDVIARCGAPA